jgi:hypothetical protein
MIDCPNSLFKRLTQYQSTIDGSPIYIVQNAHIHTWLAWQADPGTPMGLAITKKYLDANAPSAANFLRWVDRLLLR